MTIDRRELLGAALGSAIPVRIPGPTKAMYRLYYRKVGTKAWAAWGGYDSYEECKAAAEGLTEGGPYEFRVVCLQAEEL